MSTAASDSASLVRISSTTATFSGLAISLPLAELDRDVAADTRDVPSVRERLVRRVAGPEAATHYLEETGGLWLVKLWKRRSYYEAAAACSSSRVADGSIFTPGPIVELAVTAFR